MFCLSFEARVEEDFGLDQLAAVEDEVDIEAVDGDDRGNGNALLARADPEEAATADDHRYDLAVAAHQVDDRADALAITRDDGALIELFENGLIDGSGGVSGTQCALPCSVFWPSTAPA